MHPTYTKKFKMQKTNKMRTSIHIILLIFVTYYFYSCEKKNSKEMISSSKMATILEEIHLADAMLSHERVNINDSTVFQYYQYIYEKNNFTKEQFENSLKYYARNPKQLREIYNEVNKNLATRDSLMKKEESLKIDTIQLWTGEHSYKWEEYSKQTLAVAIDVDFQKTYHITAEIKIYKDSQLKEITPEFAFISPDSTYLFPKRSLTSSDEFQKISLEQMVTDSTITKLEGNFIQLPTMNEERFMHIEIKNIQIYTTQLRNQEQKRALEEVHISVQ